MLCRQALDDLAGKRGGPLFTRRETGLVAKALIRPGGLDSLVAQQRLRVLVALDDQAVVGMAVGRIEEVGEAALGVVDVLYVVPESRRLGAGRALLDELVAWFAQHRCRGVDAAALPGDRDTKNFFEGTGFKARLLTMHRPVD
ncbi:MAG: GNAT family N-acetyltransferase [Acidimicrobiales bacterium]